MKKYFFFMTLALCLLLGTAVNAKEYIVKLNRPVYQTGLLVFDDFKEIGNSDSCLYVTENLDSIKELEEKGEVVYYEEDSTITLSATYNYEFNPDYASYLNLSNNLASRGAVKGDHTVYAGVIDSGISIYDENGQVREDFKNVVAGESFVGGDPYKDMVDHGTGVAGLIASSTAGVAPDAKLVSLQAFSSSSGSISSVVQAVYAGIEKYGCKVLNISASMSSYNTSLYHVVNYANSKSVIIVAAAGNYGTTAVYFPAGLKGVIGVGSVTSSGAHHSISHVNSSVDVCAMGSYVYMPASYNSKQYYYGYNSGTSFSAPQVAGLAALLCSYDIDMTSDEFLKILEATSCDAGESGYDETYGHGIIDVKEALELVTQKPQIYTARMFKNGNKVNQKVYNNTGKEVTVTSVTANYNLDNTMDSFIPEEITIAPNEVKNICIEPTAKYLKHFIWKDIGSLLPLCKVRTF